MSAGSGTARLQGKVAIVTGAARGLGAATAERFCAEGASVVLTDITEAGEKTAATLSAQGYAARFMMLDVRDANGWTDLVDATQAAFGGVDILVNNAGIWEPGDIEALSLEALRRVHEINFIGPFLGMQAVIPAMRARGGGAIVNVASNATAMNFAAGCAYASSKAALASLSKTAALHCAEQGIGIRINSVHPGPHATAMMMSGTADQRIADAIPMKRMGRPDETAAAIAFLASDDASFITATELFVDGGLTAI